MHAAPAPSWDFDALRKAAIAAACVLLGLVLFVGAFFAVQQATCASNADAGVVEGPSAAARNGIPRNFLELYQRSGERWAIPWQAIAAVGRNESDHGRSKLPGVRSGQNSHGCCAGPMQFHNDYGRNTAGSTWMTYRVDGDGDGDFEIHDPTDAIYSAGKLLSTLFRQRGSWRGAFAGYYGADVDGYADKALRSMALYGYTGGGGQGGPLGTLLTPGAAMALAASRHSTQSSSTKMRWPTRQRTTSSSYGPRWGRMHEGLDISAPIGAPIWAPMAGRVTFSGPASGYGQLICIQHRPKLQTCYGHMSARVVKVGDEVTAGQLIAKVGNEGRSTGPHLHFEVRLSDAPMADPAIDPLPLLEGGPMPSAPGASDVDADAAGCADAAAADAGGGEEMLGEVELAPGQRARLDPDTGLAKAPEDAPAFVARAIGAANRLVGKPYKWGGGHASFTDSGYDCSGAVSYVLHAVDKLATPLDSRGLIGYAMPGRGRWITTYANNGHAYMVIAGLRFDTSPTADRGPGAGKRGARWRTARPSTNFTARHPGGM